MKTDKTEKSVKIKKSEKRRQPFTFPKFRLLFGNEIYWALIAHDISNMARFVPVKRLLFSSTKHLPSTSYLQILVLLFHKYIFAKNDCDFKKDLSISIPKKISESTTLREYHEEKWMINLSSIAPQGLNSHHREYATLYKKLL